MSDLEQKPSGGAEAQHQNDISGAVFIVDDDPEVREYLQWLLKPAGWDVKTYDSGRAFLSAFTDSGPACLITDLRMPEMDGLQLQEEVTKKTDLPVILISAHAEVPTAVEAVKAGAIDFLEKPFDGPTLIKRVRDALTASEERRKKSSERAKAVAALDRLTPRQRAVLDGLMAGQSSKEIASDLGLSPRTVDVHRFRLMHGVGAESLSDLFRLVLQARGETALKPGIPEREEE